MNRAVPTSSSIVISISCALAFVATHLYVADEKQQYRARIQQLEHRLAMLDPSQGFGPTSASLTDQLRCLADNIYHEARSESYEGQLAVATVTLNRAAASMFPDRVCQVVWQRNKFGCQFSWTCDKLSDQILNKSAYRRALQVAEDVLVDGIRSSRLNEQVLFYHAVYVRPSWFNKRSLKKVATIEQHIFYALHDDSAA